MPRTAGSKNKNSVIKTDSETEFLNDAIVMFSKWKARAQEKKEREQDNGLELEFAEAYKVIINRFTQTNS